MGKTPPSYIAVYFMAVGRALRLSYSGGCVAALLGNWEVACKCLCQPVTAKSPKRLACVLPRFRLAVSPDDGVAEHVRHPFVRRFAVGAGHSPCNEKPGKRLFQKVQKPP